MMLLKWQAIMRIHPVHWLSADAAPGGCQPQTKKINSDC